MGAIPADGVKRHYSLQYHLTQYRIIRSVHTLRGLRWCVALHQFYPPLSVDELMFLTLLTAKQAPTSSQ